MSERIVSEYFLVKSGDSWSLQSEVNAMIGGGWQPFGSACCSADSTEFGDVVFAQAMVRYTVIQ